MLPLAAAANAAAANAAAAATLPRTKHTEMQHQTKPRIAQQQEGMQSLQSQVAALMRDASLTPQERQHRIQQARLGLGFRL
jgi:hypothetical protein